MGFGKAFGFSLLAYIGLNFLFVIIANTTSGTLNGLFNAITANPLLLLFMLFGAITEPPSTVAEGIYLEINSGTLDPASLILLIGALISALIASIIAGKFGENKGGSFGGWFATSIVSAIAIIILIALDNALLPFLEIYEVLIAGVIIGLLFSCFALLFTKTEYY